MASKKTTEDTSKKTVGTIKLTLEQIIGMLNNPAFHKALERNFPFKNGYWLGRIQGQMMEEIKKYQEGRQKLIEKYAEKDDNGDPIVLDEKTGEVEFGDNRSIVTKETEKLLKDTIDIGFNFIDIDFDSLEEKEKRGEKDLPTGKDFGALAPLLK